MRLHACSLRRRRAGFRFKPCRERVAHSRRKKSGRAFCNDIRVYENQIGIAPINPVLLEYALVGIDNRKRAAGRIARRDRRAVDHGQVQVRCHGARRIQHFAAARAHDDARANRPRRRVSPLDLRRGAFAAERENRVCDAGIAKAGFPDAGKKRYRAASRDDERRPLQTEFSDFLPQLGSGVLSLRIPAGRTEYLEHVDQRIPARHLKCSFMTQQAPLIGEGETLGVIGAGVMGRTLLSGLFDSGVLLRDRAWAAASSERSCQTASERLAIPVVTDFPKPDDRIRADSALREPKQTARVIASLKEGGVRPDTLLISIMAGVTIGQLESGLGTANPWIRAMPNTPCIVREGITVICPAPGPTPSIWRAPPASLKRWGVVCPPTKVTSTPSLRSVAAGPRIST